MSFGIKNLLNAILVNEGIRPAMLIQRGDYDESIVGIEEVVGFIIKQFPELIASNDYSLNQGVILSKTDYNGRQDISLQEMGRILGYPCYEGYDQEDSINNTLYEINILLYLKNKEEGIQLIVNVCKNDTEETRSKFQVISENAAQVFSSPKYRDGILKDVKVEVERVVVSTKKIASPKSIIDKLNNDETLDEDEKNEIVSAIENSFYNPENDNSTVERFQRAVQYENSEHIKILIKILSKTESCQGYDVMPDLEEMERTKMGGGKNKKTKLKKMFSSKRKSKRVSKKKTYTKRRRSAKNKNKNKNKK